MKLGLGKIEKRGLEKGGTQILGKSREITPSKNAPINETIQNLICQGPHTWKSCPKIHLTLTI
jgi:hypothetical protein